MKFTSYFATVGVILITGASLSSSRSLPTVLSSTDIDFVGDISDRHESLFNRSGSLEIRGNVPSRRPGTTLRSSKASRPSTPTPSNENEDPTRPPGLKGALESKFWKDMKDHIASPSFKNLKPSDELTLYTGTGAWSKIDLFEAAFEKAFPGRTIRHYINVIKSDTTLQGLINRYKDEPQGRKDTLPNGVASYDLAMLTRNRKKPVHVFFSTKEMANAAVKGEIPKGHLKYYEMFPITSQGTMVTEILAWDLETYEEKLKKGINYKPPQIWKNGDLPLGKRADFTEEPAERVD